MEAHAKVYSVSVREHRSGAAQTHFIRRMVTEAVYKISATMTDSA